MTRFHPLKVKDVQRETEDAVSIGFDVPDDIAATFDFLPGQYLTVRTDIDGTPQQRTYSICSGLDDGELRIAVKRVDNGLFSNFANDNLEPGMELDVMPPLGRFTARPGEIIGGEYVALAAGSGVTPILSIVKTLLEREPDSVFTLFYGNRDRNSVIFREQLEDLKDRFLERFRLIHVLSQEGQDVDLLHGRLDAERIRLFADHRLFDPAATTTFFLCGPGTMIETGRAALESLGVEPERIRFELFTTGRQDIRPASERARKAAASGASIEAVLDGAVRSFRMGEDDESVIDAAHRQGIELPFSCKGGMCCTCRAKVREGEVEMAHNYSLEPWELKAGFVLTCQARPLTARVVLDYDDV